MAWQAIYQNAVARGDRVAFSILYTDGVSKIFRDYAAVSLTDAVIQQIARDAVAELSAVSAPSKVTIANGAAIDLTPPVVDPPVDPDPARTQFLSDYRLLQTLERGVSAGLIATDDKAVTDQRTKVQGEYKSAYAGLL